MSNVARLITIVCAAFLFAGILAIFPTKTALAHCTGYHPHHCKPEDLDPFNKNSGIRRTASDVERQLQDILHLGGLGCLTKANSVLDSHIDNRSNPALKGLTDREKRYLRPWFGELIDLDRVTVFWGANLNSEMKIGNYTLWVASSAQTFGYRIFFKERRQGSTEQLISLAHELTHVVQYERAGKDMLKFCQRYMNGLTDAGLDYYDNPMESEAFDLDFRFAQWLTDVKSGNGMSVSYEHGMPNNYRTTSIPECLPGSSTCGQFYFKNNCTRPLKLILRYKQINGDWITRGWWNFSPGEGAYLSSSNSRIQSDNSVFYYYAEIPNQSYSWSGDEPREYNGTTYSMRKKTLTTNSNGNWSLSLSCGNQ